MQDPEAKVARATPARSRRFALLLALSGVVGLAWSPLAGWIWSALWAPAAGALAASRLRGVLGLAPPLVWAALLLVLGGGAAAGGAGVCALAALYALGLALGGRAAAASAAGPGLALLVSGALTALPSLGGALSAPLPPALTARLLDLSPVAWVTESAGLDWMRHASVYEAAGSGDLGPELRSPHAGCGAPLALLSGALALWALRGRRGPARES